MYLATLKIFISHQRNKFNTVMFLFAIQNTSFPRPNKIEIKQNKTKKIKLFNSWKRSPLAAILAEMSRTCGFF